MTDKKTRKAARKLLAAGLAVAGLIVQTTVLAATFPDRPVRLIVPYPPGGTSDNVARSIQQPLEKALGQTVIIENVSGSAGTVGTAALADAKPDGYTVGINASATITTSPHLTPVNYDLDSFAPVARVAISYLGIAVRPDFPASNFKEFVEYAKTHRVTVSNTGIGATTHLCVEALKKETGTQLVQVPFKGSSPSMNAVINGHIDAVCDPALINPMQSGILKPIVTLTPERWKEIPDTPTYKEATGKAFPVTNWYVALAPAGTPDDRLQILTDAFKQALDDPDLAKRFASMGIQPYFSPSAEVEKELHEEFDTRGDTLKDLGLTQ
ncbi:tripartite tricarboxylate transporter substrate binding protein [Salinisphaera sp. T31B1]|uniref:Bug family tripartite tricarboxylate transporter substrate binding protein n=1 Tax=Salinisphaera sp. T31B1 TaxID=727963 RepID=UPI003340843B